MKKSWLITVLLSLALLAAFIIGCNSSTATPAAISTATGLMFVVEPAGATAGAVFTTQPVVDVVDASGNIVTGYNGVVDLTITTGTGASGATLTGTANVDAVNGVATFTDLSIDTAGSAYSLLATNDILTTSISDSFDVAAAPATTTGS